MDSPKMCRIVPFLGTFQLFIFCSALGSSPLEFWIRRISNIAVQDNFHKGFWNWKM